jgi:hypothetical protein
MGRTQTETVFAQGYREGMQDIFDMLGKGSVDEIREWCLNNGAVAPTDADASIPVFSGMHNPAGPNHYYAHGEHVIVTTSPENGTFDGIIHNIDGNRMVVMPLNPAVRNVFPNGYDMGRAHWADSIRPYAQQDAD